MLGNVDQAAMRLPSLPAKRPSLRLHALPCGGEVAPASAFDPFGANRGADIEVPFFAYLIVHPRGVVLVDTGPHARLIDDPVAHLGAEAETFDIRCTPDDLVSIRLRAVGLATDDVTHVVQSHLHYDHAGGLSEFLHARWFVQRRELAFARHPPRYQRGFYVSAEFDHAGAPWTLLDGQHDLFGDGGIVVIPTPGHTPGHQSVVVGLDGWTAVLAGDAAYSQTAVETVALPAGALTWSADAMIDSWNQLSRLCDARRAELVPTHDLDGRARALLRKKGALQ
jgi:N-acyl homoserine lactone hydrolase